MVGKFALFEKVKLPKDKTFQKKYSLILLMLYAFIQRALQTSHHMENSC